MRRLGAAFILLCVLSVGLSLAVDHGKYMKEQEPEPEVDVFCIVIQIVDPFTGLCKDLKITAETAEELKRAILEAYEVFGAWGTEKK